MDARRLGQRPLDPFVQPVHHGQRLVGFLAGAEQDRLLDLRRAREPLEGPVAERGAQHRAGVGERLQGADQQRPLPVEQADRALAVHPARHRAAGREVVGRRLRRGTPSVPGMLLRLRRTPRKARPRHARASPSASGVCSSCAAKISSRSSRVSVSRSSALAARSSRHSRLAASSDAGAPVRVAGQRHRRHGRRRGGSRSETA